MAILRPKKLKWLLKYFAMAWMVRTLSSLVSRSWAPASWASVCWNDWSVVRRTATVMVSPVTPLEVAPPLSPEKRTHGGE